MFIQEIAHFFKDNELTLEEIRMLSCHPACIPINMAIQFKLHTKIHVYGFSASSKLKWNNWFVDFQVAQNLKRLLKFSVFTFFLSCAQ